MAGHSPEGFECPFAVFVASYVNVPNVFEFLKSTSYCIDPM